MLKFYLSTTLHIITMEIRDLQTTSQSRIYLFPNPAIDSFQVGGVDGTAKVIISNMHCRVFITKDIVGDESICLKSLPKGIYIVKIITEERIERKKLEKK